MGSANTPNHPRSTRLRVACYKICTNHYWGNFILVCILISSIVLAAEDPLDAKATRNLVRGTCDDDDDDDDDDDNNVKANNLNHGDGNDDVKMNSHKDDDADE